MLLSAHVVRIACCFFLTWPLVSHAAPTERPNAVTADGGRYYGPLVDGRFHGRGRIEWGNGARYDGDFVSGHYSGRGRMRFGSGDIYEGGFRNGLMEGRGRLHARDGSVYVGQFRNNLFHGRGRHKTAAGDFYDGSFKNGYFHGHGRLTETRSTYEGQFANGRYSGKGEVTYDDGAKYRGEFIDGRFHGKGRYENSDGEIYEGTFEKEEFIEGTHSHTGGGRSEGRFIKWRLSGSGTFTDARGDKYEGEFVDGTLSGACRLTGKHGGFYEGLFRQWRFHGPGVLRLPNGDIYKGEFANGFYEGEGTLTYATPRPDGRTYDTGRWRYGMLVDEEAQRQAKVNVETALYSQRALLDAALASLAPRDPNKINLYLLAIAGDGSQEVFRREVEFVQQQFAQKFGTSGRAIALINSRNTVATVPMATMTSIRDSLNAIAARMDKERDILFLFLTSHGSKEHELTLNQNNMSLRSLPARELGELLKETGVRWRVVVISACYGGGFVEPIKNDQTLVMTAARHDRQSFGCADDNDFTYFGRAFFKEALPQSGSFQEAFHRAEVLVREWESKDMKSANKSSEPELSLPQMENAEPIDEYLQRWWAQFAK